MMKTMDKSIAKVFKSLFERPSDSHKYDFGHVLVVGGAPGMVGAPLLTARAALRVGAGLVTIASTPKVVDKLEKRVEEVMTARLAIGQPRAAAELTRFIKERRVNALAIGPGLAPDRDSTALVRQLLGQTRLPVVLDAGGLAAYQGRLSELEALSHHNPAIVLTPHAGEFAKLTGRAVPSAAKDALLAMADAVAATGTTIVFKGHRSLVYAPGGHHYVNSTGNPGLATAGTGDVLTGIIAGILGQGFSAFEAASAGVYLHGLAGDLAAAAKTEPGLLASDLIEFIPAALRKLADTPDQ